MKKKDFLKYLILFLFCLFLLNLPDKYIQEIKYKTIKFFKPPFIFLKNIANFFLHYADSQKLILENKKISAENIQLKLENSRLNSLREENEKLRELLGFKKQIPYTAIAGEVIGLNYSENEKVIFVGLGENNGISKNMICLNSSGLIGKVVETGENISKIICITDPRSRVPAKTTDTNDFGLVYGSTTGEVLQMKFLPKDSLTKIGARVVTSGLGKIYPKGISIGEIFDIKEEEFYKTAFIKPGFDFSDLEVVLLVK